MIILSNCCACDALVLSVLRAFFIRTYFFYSTVSVSLQFSLTLVTHNAGAAPRRRARWRRLERARLQRREHSARHEAERRTGEQRRGGGRRVHSGGEEGDERPVDVLEESHPRSPLIRSFPTVIIITTSTTTVAIIGGITPIIKSSANFSSASSPCP